MVRVCGSVDRVRRRRAECHAAEPSAWRHPSGRRAHGAHVPLGWRVTVRAAGAADDAVSKADDSIVAYEAFIASEDTAERGRILDGILDYNTHDVRATHAVHLWLHELASQLEPDDLLDEPEAALSPQRQLAVLS